MSLTLPTLNEAPTTDPPADDKGTKRATWLRLGLLAIVLGGISLFAHQSEYLKDVSLLTVKQTVENAGAWGIIVFALLFVIGVLLHLPGMLFVGSAILVFGRVSGYFISLGSATLAVCVSFLLVRTIGGKAFNQVKSRRVQKLLERIDDHPVRVMILFRLIFFLSPPLNFMIALTRIRFRDFALGSFLGLIIPMLVITVFFDWLLATEWVRSWLFD